MASTTMATVAPQTSLPQSPPASPFKNLRAAPCTQKKTAKLWDQYEKEAVENARRRETTHGAPTSQRYFASDIRNDHFKSPSLTIATSAKISFDFNFADAAISPPPLRTVAKCRSCRQPTMYASSDCERCNTTMTRSPPTGVITPPLSPSSRNFAWTDVPQRHRESTSDESSTSNSASSERTLLCPPPTLRVDLPVRQSSLHPPRSPDFNNAELDRGRKGSLTDPNEPFLRHQIAHQRAFARSPCSNPTSPTFPPASRPHTSHSYSPAYTFGHVNVHPMPLNTRHIGTSTAELSARPHTSATLSPASRPSIVQHNTSSAWDDWNSDDEEEQIRLVGWIG
ncbi:hypothetical protein P153DRAFT_275721, partial [Dothidotthia symphoricarpi CBS 119687]